MAVGAAAATHDVGAHGARYSQGAIRARRDRQARVRGGPSRAWRLTPRMRRDGDGDADHALMRTVAQCEAREATMLRWLRRWRERDDRRLVKRVAPLPDVDPIEELARVVGEAQERDADDEARLDRLTRGDRPPPYRRRRPDRR